MVVAATAEASVVGAGEFKHLPLASLVASKTNPRTHFSDAYIAELSTSIREKGLIQPIVVRPNGKAATFEIVAGECRFRASKLAALETVPVIVRSYTDEQVLDVQLMENIHRTDLTPLEQAVGYRRLIEANPTKYSAATIATRIGMSPAWVWDRLKLNDLIADAKQLLEAERISESHAIVLARLTPDQQARAIHPDKGGLFESEDAHLGFDPATEKTTRGKYDGLKPRTVNELKAWVADNIRFDVEHAAKAAPLEFEEVKARVDAAQAKPGRGKKVVAITFDHQAPQGAKDEHERTYGRESFRFADGEKHAVWFPRRIKIGQPCEYSVLGVVAAGEQHYGETFEVCVARDRCHVHFGDVIREREKNAKLRESGKTKQADRREATWEIQERRRREESEKQEARWKTFYPALRKAVSEARAKLKAVNGPIYVEMLKANRLPAGTKPADLPMALLDLELKKQFSGHVWYGNEARVVAWAKLLGVDVKACEPEVPKAEKKASAKPAKTTARKKR